MPKHLRDDSGKFDLKSQDYRHVRSIRVTDEAWEKFGELASELDLTRADLLELWVGEKVNTSIWWHRAWVILLRSIRLRGKSNENP